MNTLGTSQNQGVLYGLYSQGRSANKANLLSGNGRFLLSREDAERQFNVIKETVRSQWHAVMRRAGVTEADCERIARAFLYDGLLFDG